MHVHDLFTREELELVRSKYLAFHYYSSKHDEITTGNLFHLYGFQMMIAHLSVLGDPDYMRKCVAIAHDYIRYLNLQMPNDYYYSLK